MKAPVIAFVLLSSSLAAQSGPFEWGELLEARPFGSFDVDVVDVDLDGVDDLVVCGQNRDVDVFLGDGDGTFTHGPESDFPVSGVVERLAVGDVTGDGLPDVVTAGEASTRLLPGKGDGSFELGPTLSSAAPVVPRLADVDGDGDLDLVLLEEDDDADTRLVVYRQTPAGLVADPPFDAVGARDVVTPDVDADGDVDLVTVGTARLFVWLGDGAGAFTPTDTVPVAGLPAGTFDLAVAALDDDAVLDVVIVASDGASGTLRSFLGDGAGGFAQVDVHAAGAFAQGLALGDADGDGEIDAVFAVAEEEAGIRFAAGLGDGTFAAPEVAVPTDAPAQRIAIADVDGDGLAETAVAFGAEYALGVLHVDDASPFERSVSAQPPAPGRFTQILADVDGDGRDDLLASGEPSTKDVRVAYGLPGPDFAAPVQVLAGVRADDIVAADFDRDGDADLALRTDFFTEQLWNVRNLGGGAFEIAEATFPAPAVLFRGGPFAADFTGDGRADRVLVRDETGTLTAQVFVSASDGTTDAVLEAPLGTSNHGRTAHAVGDVDGDGVLDLVSLPYEPFGSPDEVRVASGLGDGTFVAGPTSTYESFVDHFFAELADLDRDGDLDLVALARQGEVVWENDGGGAFTLRVDRYTGDNQLELGALVDVDHDGGLDIVRVLREVDAIQVTPLRDDLTFGETRFYAPWTVGPELLAAGDVDGRDGRDFVFLDEAGRLHAWTSRDEAPRWADRGQALAGAHATLRLTGGGAAAAGEAGSFALSQGEPGQAVFLVVGAPELLAPLKGGLLVPHPQIVLPSSLGPGGALVLPFVWPAGVPSGVTVTTQAWASDPAAVVGYTASNAVAITEP